MSSLKNIDPQIETKLRAAVFRALRDHLQSRTDVQNIDMMNRLDFAVFVEMDSSWFRTWI